MSKDLQGCSRFRQGAGGHFAALRNDEVQSKGHVDGGTLGTTCGGRKEQHLRVTLSSAHVLREVGLDYIRRVGYTDQHMSLKALDVRSLSRLFKALADETRLRIVALLSHGDLCVCHLEEALRLSQPKVSRHLATLRAAGVVEDHRDGTWVYYRLLPQPDADCQRQLRELVRTFAKRSVLRKDLERLVKVRGPESCK